MRYLNLFKIAILLLVQLILGSSCAKKVPLSYESLLGKSATEITDLKVKIDTTITRFYRNHNYLRTGLTYLQAEGQYEVKNDTLTLYYDCNKSCCDCGNQKYILMNDGNLHLVFLKDRFGNIEDLKDTQFDKVLELK